MRLFLVWLWAILVLHTSSGVNRQQRSLTSLFGATSESPPLKFPVWKVHKYTGVELRPVRPDEHDNVDTSEYGIYEPREVSGEPPSLVEVPDFGAQHHSDEKRPGEGFLLRLFGIGSSDHQAEEKVGVAGALVAPHIIKKKKQFLGLAALPNLLKLVNDGTLSGPVDIQQLLGNVWDTATSPKSTYPVKNTIYKEIPSSYPSSPSLLSRIPIIGTYFAPSGTEIKLPQPALPHIPQLKLVPEAPKLPRLYIPGPYSVPYSSGSYVSIKLPTPPKVQELLPSSLPPYPAVSEVPLSSYGIPVEIPKNVYGTPADHAYPNSGYPQYKPPAQEYGQPQQNSLEHQQFLPHNQPAPEFGPAQLYSPPAQEYGPSQQHSPPAQEYGPPQQHSPPAQEYGPPQQHSPPAQEYGPPQQHSPPAQEYGLPQQYSPPAQEYGLPQQHSPPAQEYGPPQQYSPPAHEYGPPQQYSPPAPEYGPPQQHSSPSQEYGQPQHYSPSAQQSLPKQHAQKKSSEEEISGAQSETLTALANEWKGSNELGQGTAVNEVNHQL